MPGTSHRARYALGSTIFALTLAFLVGALPIFRGASADNTRELIRLSFRPASTQPAEGWRSDNGAPFDTRRAYGWVRDNDTTTPTSMADEAVSRSGKVAPVDDTFITMQPPKQRWGRWVMLVENGTYRVTATVGDASGAPGKQSLGVEGQRVIEDFTPTRRDGTKTETIDVEVTDGRLTVDPLYPDRGTKTKLVSLIVRVVLDDDTPPPTTEPPTTEPPTTEPPTTEPPITLPPTTLPPITLPPTTLPPSGLRNQMGFAGGGLFLSGSDAEIQRELDGMAATGATWLRIGFLWSAIESKGPGQYSFKKLDQVVGWAKDRGLRIVANVSYTPVWARPASCKGDMTCAPADVDLYARFMGALVRHYAPMGVKHYEVWNEPNMNIFWKPRPEPVRYGEMLRKAFLQAHLADPTVNVMAGAFAPARDNEAGTTQNPRTFLTGMYRAGIAGQFDSLSIHPYSGDVDPRTLASWNMMLGVAPDLVQIMESHGDFGKKIWGTEMSYATGSSPKSVSEKEQARLLKLAIEVWRQQDYAGVLFFFTYRDIGTNPGAISENYGLVRRDFRPKQALYEMRDFLNS